MAYWPHWLPKGPPLIELSKAQWAYLLPAQRDKLFARRETTDESFFWTGSKSELAQLLRYFD